MQIKWKLSVSVAAILTVLSFSCPPADGQRLENIWMDRLVNVTPLERQQDTISLFFIGDVMMHARQLEYDFRTFLEPLRSRISGADLAVANMEFTLAGEPYSGYPAFSAPDGYAAYLADLGTDVFLTANNHILDKGRDGLERTIEVYRAMDGILMTGTSEDPEHDEASYPLMVSVKGTRIALINFT
ncbi:MAG: CapA family protein, partial [Bacteroidales bacterium]|nr:CapA family protein [Bacteroidales bacterium]